MRGAGHADVLDVLQVNGNKADAVPCEPLQCGRSAALGTSIGKGTLIEESLVRLPTAGHPTVVFGREWLFIVSVTK